MTSEIGSEFYLKKAMPDLVARKKNVDFFRNAIFTLSGRTSLYGILKNLPQISSNMIVYLPSYCCSSMIQPIEDLGMYVKFYEVSYDNMIKQKLNFFKDANVILLMSYFGIVNEHDDELVKKYQQNGCVVIEDITHSAFSLESIGENMQSDYRIASLRKWFPLISGGIVYKKNSDIYWNLEEPNKKQLWLRYNAMVEKGIFIENEKSDQQSKKKFLKNYTIFNKYICHCYQNKSIDTLSKKIVFYYDISKMKKIRRNNAEFLMEKLKGSNYIHLIYDHLNVYSCPLFVPVFAVNRNKLQDYLISKSIYCPIHWTKPSEQSFSNLYNNELSLICDQRYTEKDMQRIVKEIHKFYGEYEV